MPHWVQLTKNGFSTEEFVKMTDEVLNANRVTAQKREMKLNELVKRKRSGDELKTHLIETKKNRDSYTKKTEGMEREKKATFSNLLNMPSTSTGLIPSSEASFYKTKRMLKEGIGSMKDTKTAKTAIANNDEDSSHGDCAGMVF
ncbi:hypothetical protein WUBG_07372 [Wuchereria bancrofti]|uniref:Uncharacterized protein n=1 Tax=Wuchereria bancrofti TaxID=6293 RepID=J9EHT0_WUCBA|nr:hypothetical protein WUBG_07372 [Wuchereria bancrofti]